MHKWLARTLIAAGSAIAVTVAAVGYTTYTQLHPALPRPLTELGGIELEDGQGRPIRLAQAVAPRSAAIIAFWATWCAPCRNEAIGLAKLRRKYSASELSIIYLNVDEQPDGAAAAKFLRATHAENLPVLYGRAAWATITGQRTIYLPRAYVFDRSGHAVSAVVGATTDGTTRDLDDSVAKAVR